jgi:hypothetical protein
MSNNLEGFINIIPFDKQINVLDPDVCSDHTEIGLEIDTNMYILSWNISNPKYHTYFKYGSTFKHTHLYVEEPYINDKLVYCLEDKIQKQLDVFKNNIDSGVFPIQVIIEGFDSFYKRLENILTSYPNIRHSLIRHKPTETYHTSNISAILVDTNMFDVLESGIQSIEYSASEDNDKIKTTMFPFVRLCNKYTNDIYVVIAIHVNGCNSQYPISGLESLKDFIMYLYTEYQNNIIAIGDYNTTPLFAHNIFNNEQFNILTTKFLTHCNPNCQACKYDMAITYPKSYVPKVMDVDFVSDYSLALIDSIDAAIIKNTDIA